MLSPPQKAGELLKSIKRRLKGVSGKTSNKITKSNLVTNLKRAIQSTPDLLKMQGGPYERSSPLRPSLSQDMLGELPLPEPTQATAPQSLETESIASSPTAVQFSHSQEKAKPMPQEEVLFLPPKDDAKSPKSNKMKLKLSLGKSRLPTEYPEVEEAVVNLPMITLTKPDDEQIYILHRPTPPILTHKLLAVPNRATASISELPKVSAKQWPHPAGPWLRPTTSEENKFKAKSDQAMWEEGWRLGTGAVIGWDPEYMEALGIDLAPHLPTEQELEAIALVEKISRSLDQAQDALFGSLQMRWEAEMNEQNDQMTSMEGSCGYPADAEPSHEVQEGLAL
ncbi:hypothetical protein PTTG_12526 [Puccinia triticina 1-1 BBBD Race 1]|uniref:Uncharacterized protein n=2 Tax=Puccinia triticina TaxID=208348 RepID=A0A180G949_PUCT1|nr:hypothetical protein PTTG_12526 [Puccinia triticina 1-1 BBBD Race 1]WAR59520.1 hypothetical protein PtB15_11B160 [Puccinia triticina]